jgi:rod shape-determining protein MreC
LVAIVAKIFTRRSVENKALLVKQVFVLVAKVSLVIFIGLSIILFAVNRSKPELVEPIRAEVVETVSPLVIATNKILRGVKLIYEQIGDILTMNTHAEETRKLQDEILTLKLKNVKLEEENIRLAKLTNFLPGKEFSFSSARIISRTPGPNVLSAYVYSKDLENVNEENVVINDDGLVGQIERKADKIAEILLITDKRSNVPVITKNSRKRAILVGNGTRNPELQFLDNAQSLVVGEEIITSGDGGIFPPDLQIGYIDKINKDQVFIETFANWNKLEYVFIIK